MSAVADLLGAVHECFESLDILINKAAQTVRRPAAYYREILARESEPLTGLAARAVVTGAAAAGRFLEPRAGVLGLLARDQELAAADDALAVLFPAGRADETGQPLDLRAHSSWNLRLHEVPNGRESPSSLPTRIPSWPDEPSSCASSRP